MTEELSSAEHAVRTEFFTGASGIIVGGIKANIAGRDQHIYNYGPGNGGEPEYSTLATKLILISGLTSQLQPIPDASHTRNRKQSPPDSLCIPGTRKKVIKKIITWASSSVLYRREHVFWLHGYVGCGKSAIAQTVAEEFEKRRRLAASFFFFRGSGGRSRSTKLAATLACQLAAAMPEIGPHIEASVKAHAGLLTNEVSIGTQFQYLIYDPFQTAVSLKSTLLKGPFLIIIDGLDECEDREEVADFIEHMLRFFKTNPLVPLRFFIASRVEQHIQAHLKSSQVNMEDLVNHTSDNDIATFMREAFAIAAKRNPVIQSYIQSHGEWPARSDFGKLVGHAGGSFIFASTLFKYIVGGSNDSLTPMDRLPLALDINPGLDELYSSTLSRSKDLPRFSDIISAIALLETPLSISSLAKLLDMQPFEIVHVLVNLQAVIQVPGDDETPVTLCHSSLHDFLNTESRSGPFFAAPSYHMHLAFGCLRILCLLPPDDQEWDFALKACAALRYSRNHHRPHQELFREGARGIDEATLHDMFSGLISLLYEKAPLHLPHVLRVYFLLEPSGRESFDDNGVTLALLPPTIPVLYARRVVETLDLIIGTFGLHLSHLSTPLQHNKKDKNHRTPELHSTCRQYFLGILQRTHSTYVTLSHHTLLAMRCLRSLLPYFPFDLSEVEEYALAHWSVHIAKAIEYDPAVTAEFLQKKLDVWSVVNSAVGYAGPPYRIPIEPVTRNLHIALVDAIQGRYKCQ